MQTTLLALPKERQQLAFVISFAVFCPLVGIWVRSLLHKEHQNLNITDDQLSQANRVRGGQAAMAVQTLLTVAIFAIFTLGVGPPFTEWFDSWGLDSAFRTALAGLALLILAFVLTILDAYEVLPTDLHPLKAVAGDVCAAATADVAAS